VLFLHRIILVFPKPRDDLVDAIVLVRGFLGGSRDDERRPRFVDEDAVDLVDDGVVEVPLDVVFQRKLHVVAQIIEAELVVRPVGDIGRVGLTALVVVHPVDDHADRQPQEAVNRSHPAGIAFRQVVVDRDDMDAFPRQRIQIDGHRRGKGLALTGLHFGDLSLVQDDASDDLHIEGSHLQRAARGLPGDREGFGKEVLHRRPAGQPLPEDIGLRPQFRIGPIHHGRFFFVDLIEKKGQALEIPLVLAAENLLQYCPDHHHLPNKKTGNRYRLWNVLFNGAKSRWKPADLSSDTFSDSQEDH